MCNVCVIILNLEMRHMFNTVYGVIWLFSKTTVDTCRVHCVQGLSVTGVSISRVDLYS